MVGPVAFVAAWSVGAFVNDRNLSAVDDAISQLAHVDSNTRWLMTAGFLVFGVAVGSFAFEARDALGTAGAIALAATAVSTIAVAALPLGVSQRIDALHGLAAGIGYVTLAAAPVAAARPLCRRGERALAAGGVAASAVAAVSLALSLGAEANGGLQRLGLTVVDIWIVATATRLATRGRTTSGT